MKYKHIIPARFISRPNRFIAYCEVDGVTETVHVKNTGRCRELLLPDTRVYLSVSDNPARKTKYDLVAVEKIRQNGEAVLINMDSQAPNEMAYEWLKKTVPGASIKREVRFGNSRFDLYFEDGDRRGFIEVKGCTLEQDGIAMFPDAPTERGVKHIYELIEAKNAGYEAYVLFVIQMKGIGRFEPNSQTHPEFAKALKTAQEAGVKVLAYDSIVTPDSAEIDAPVETKI